MKTINEYRLLIKSVESKEKRKGYTTITATANTSQRLLWCVSPGFPGFLTAKLLNVVMARKP